MPGRSGLVTRLEAAELVGVSVSTIDMWVHRGHLKATEHLGNHGEKLYLTDDVYAAERGRRHAQPSTTRRRHR